jgi:hypothetical protein
VAIEMMLRARGPLHTKGAPLFWGLVLKMLDADLAGLLARGSASDAAQCGCDGLCGVGGGAVHETCHEWSQKCPLFGRAMTAAERMRRMRGG